MTRKHFIATAAIVAQISDDAERIRCADAFADLFAAANPLFNRARFMRACLAD